ncbi:MAG: 5-formyltetrahydrofolate cyclo-ligase [Clostridiales bacterium]|nr:5-formyltetrahydrofolate cyclo-ligase [Clostridiales bacterium]
MADLEKNHLRNSIRAMRRGLDSERRMAMDRAICERVLVFPQIVSADIVYLYASTSREVDTWRLINALWERGVRTALPVVENGEIIFRLVSDKASLREGSFGILEPASAAAAVSGDEARMAPVITPGLAFTRRGDRLGYGGGYYDRFFAREPAHRRIALAYPFQIVDSLPGEPWDQRVDWIITPDDVIETQR